MQSLAIVLTSFEMKKVLSFLLASGAFVQCSNATIIVTIDSPTELEGTFTIEGLNPVGETFSPTSFVGLLPEDSQLSLQRFADPELGLIAFFGTAVQGVPQDPFVGNVVLGPTTFPDNIGVFSNNPSGTVVDFLVTGSDTGSEEGTFSGTFRFSVRGEEVPGVPDSGASAALLALGLFGCMAVKGLTGKKS